jgi:hypothetical protein
MDFTPILCMLVGWMTTLSGVIVGGYIGYRSKHGGYEPFIKPKSPPDEPFNLTDDLDKVFQPDEDGPEPPEILSRMNERFRSQAAKDLGVDNAV